jgi:hypothetical protein
LTKESLTLANASFKALGQVVWGLVSTPYRIFAHDIPEFRDAARERAEGKDRFWDVLFTGTSIMGDITALYGGYQLAGKTGIVNKIEGYNTIYPHRTIL